MRAAIRAALSLWIGGGICCCAIALLACARIVGAEDRPATDSNVDVIQFKAPAGWQATDPPGATVRFFTSPDSDANRQAYIAVGMRPPKDRLDLRAEFEDSAKQTLAGARVIEAGEVKASKTRQGFDALSQTRVAESPDGKRVRLRIVAAQIQNRVAVFSYLSNDAGLFERHQGEMDDLLGSVSFKTAPGGAAAAAAAPAAVAKAKAELDALEQQKQDLIKKLNEIDARQRQLAAIISGGAPGTAGAASLPGVARQRDVQLLAEATERFAKEIDKRRKPHRILGDILTLDGKPIPNVVSYQLYVGGTTVAAERTHYDLDVDGNGHFEQQVADGSYRIQVVCIVNVAGQRIPVDLVSLDGKELVDQLSAPGIVKDYRLVLTGLKAGEDPKSATAFYGGAFAIHDTTADEPSKSLAGRYPGTRLHVTLTPRSAWADGSAGDPIAFDLNPGDTIFGQARVRGIPLGVYSVGMSLIGQNGGKVVPLQCGRKFGEFGPSTELVWEGTGVNTILHEDPKLFIKD
jgi:hypothetical protein